MSDNVLVFKFEPILKRTRLLSRLRYRGGRK